MASVATNSSARAALEAAMVPSSQSASSPSRRPARPPASRTRRMPGRVVPGLDAVFPVAVHAARRRRRPGRARRPPCGAGRRPCRRPCLRTGCGKVRAALPIPHRQPAADQGPVRCPCVRETRMRWSFRYAPLPLSAANSSLRTGSNTQAAVSLAVLLQGLCEIAQCGMACRKLLVPSRGSTMKRCSGKRPSRSPPLFGEDRKVRPGPCAAARPAPARRAGRRRRRSRPVP